TSHLTLTSAFPHLSIAGAGFARRSGGRCSSRATTRNSRRSRSPMAPRSSTRRRSCSRWAGSSRRRTIGCAERSPRSSGACAGTGSSTATPPPTRTRSTASRAARAPSSPAASGSPGNTHFRDACKRREHSSSASCHSETTWASWPRNTTPPPGASWATFPRRSATCRSSWPPMSWTMRWSGRRLRRFGMPQGGTMAKLIYSVIESLDGFVADEDGNFDWAEPDEEVHAFVNDLERPVGTYLYGRRMYEVMNAWETMEVADQPAFIQDFAAIWRAADKLVYSRTLAKCESAKTRIERDLHPEAV